MEFTKRDPDPQSFARRVLDDIEVTLAEAQYAADEWNYERLSRAFDDIAAHVKAWRNGPISPSNQEIRRQSNG